MGTLNIWPEQRLSASRVTAVLIFMLLVFRYTPCLPAKAMAVFDEKEQDKVFVQLDDAIAVFLRKACHINPKSVTDADK